MSNFRFVPFPVSLENYYYKSTDTEKALIYFFLKAFHFNNFAKCTGLFSIQEISQEINRNRNVTGRSLKILENDGLILCEVDNKNKKLKIKFNRKYLNEPVGDMRQKVADICNKTLHDMQQNIADDATKGGMMCNKSLHDMQQNIADAPHQTIENTDTSESPNNYINNIFNNIYNNSIKKEINVSELDLNFLNAMSFEKISCNDYKNKSEELFIKPSHDENKLSQSGKILETLKVWGFMKFADSTAEQTERRVINKVRSFNNDEVLTQMIEFIKFDKGITDNEGRCKMLNYFMKNPDKFNYSPGLVSQDNYDKMQQQKEYLKPLKDIFDIKSVKNPDDIMSEFIDRIVSYTENSSKGYIKSADDLVKETIRQAEENHRQAPRLFPEVTAEKKKDIHNKIHDRLDAERNKFQSICEALKKAYSVNDLKTIINLSLKNNQTRGKIKSFCSFGIDTATVKILRNISEMVKDFQIDNISNENNTPFTESKIMTIEEVKSRKPQKLEGLQPLKEIIAGYIPHADKNPELVDYVVKNLEG